MPGKAQHAGGDVDAVDLVLVIQRLCEESISATDIQDAQLFAAFEQIDDVLLGETENNRIQVIVGIDRIPELFRLLFRVFVPIGESRILRDGLGNAFFHLFSAISTSEVAQAWASNPSPRNSPKSGTG